MDDVDDVVDVLVYTELLSAAEGRGGGGTRRRSGGGCP
jgi:hypothetical protein